MRKMYNSVEGWMWHQFEMREEYITAESLLWVIVVSQFGNLTVLLCVCARACVLKYSLCISRPDWKALIWCSKWEHEVHSLTCSSDSVPISMTATFTHQKCQKRKCLMCVNSSPFILHPWIENLHRHNVKNQRKYLMSQVLVNTRKQCADTFIYTAL